MKPLGIKNYGSIPHLPNSRMGPGDHHCHEGQARIATIKARDKYDEIIVQEKIDGCNVGVARIGNEIVALTRSGYTAWSSTYEQHHWFAVWVKYRERLFREVLHDGERLVGEWIMLAHGTRYAPRRVPFIAFDLMVGTERADYDTFMGRVDCAFPTAHLLHRGGPLSVEGAMSLLGDRGYYDAMDAPEGAVWRVQRQGAVDFLVKYVRPDKVDGQYLEQVVWNVTPKDLIRRLIEGEMSTACVWTERETA